MNDPPNQAAAKIWVGVQKRRQHCEWFLHVNIRAVDMCQDAIEKRMQINPLIFKILNTPAITARCIEDGKVQLFFIGIKSHKQIKDLIHNLFGPAVTAVNLVDDDHRA